MTFDWVDFLNLANSLSSKADESSKRSAISRAYYAAFCSARDRLTASGIDVPRTGKAHERVPELYGYSGDWESQQIKEMLTREKVIRNSADYDKVFDCAGADLSSATERSIKRAEKTIQRVNNMPENIIDEIKAKS